MPALIFFFAMITPPLSFSRHISIFSLAFRHFRHADIIADVSYFSSSSRRSAIPAAARVQPAKMLYDAAAHAAAHANA
jgi:hypothetical protein